MWGGRWTQLLLSDSCPPTQWLAPVSIRLRTGRWLTLGGLSDSLRGRAGCRGAGEGLPGGQTEPRPLRAWAGM